MTEPNDQGDTPEVLTQDEAAHEVASNALAHGGRIMPGSEMVERWTRAAKDQIVDDAEAVNRALLQRLATASTADEILADAKTIAGREFDGIPFTLMDVRWSESTFDEGSEVYAHLDAKVIANGDTVVVSCGAFDVMAKAYHLKIKDLLPVDVVIRKADRPTARGFYPLSLVSAPKVNITGDEPF